MKQRAFRQTCSRLSRLKPWHGSVWFGLWLALVVQAQQLPVKSYTTADGLPHNHINRIKRDSRGYLWICTDEGLARFDGYRFSNYGTTQGLPNLTINDFLETRDGTYWVATDGGVCLFNPQGKAAPPNANQPNPVFTVYRVSEREETNHVNGLLADPDGSLWLATSGGLFHLQRAHGQARIDAVEIGYPAGNRDQRHVTKLAYDSRGTLWAMSISGLYRRPAGGGWERYGVEHGLSDTFVQSLFEDRRGRLWLGSRNHGLHLLVANPQPGQRIVEKTYARREGLPGVDVRNILPLADGRAWLCIVGGLVLLDPAANDDRKFLTYTTANGLASDEVYNALEDRAGNLWLGTRSNGVMRLPGSGFSTFGTADGYLPTAHNTIREADNGELLIFNGSYPHQRFVQVFDGQQFTRVPYRVAKTYGFTHQQAILQDQRGEWWVATDFGLYRYPPLARIADLVRAKPRAIYTKREGLEDNMIERLFEDQRGDIWIATYPNERIVNRLHRWQRATDKIQQFDLTEAEAPNINVNAFGEDAQGNLWIAFSGTKAVTRYRDGQFKQYTVANGAPSSVIHSFFLDSQKHFWLATKETGLHRVDEVTADRLRLTTWDVSKGLATNEVWSITEDQWGRIYAGTGRGVDRLDPATGFIRHFTFADGLTKGEVRVSLRDRRNQLWFVTEQGISRLVPKREEAQPAPPVLITAMRVNGNPVPLFELGTATIDDLSFAPEQNSVQLDFVSLDYSAGARLHYQYQLNEQGWSAPDDLRTISLANLAPGDYRFAVRALNSSGVISNPPATAAFTIRRPLWQRGWFLGLALLGCAGMGYGAYRYRLTQLLRLERMRTRIATDLHDDLGANLTRIAILSEVAKQQNDGPAPTLNAIADIARESVTAMSDIVWAINPERDNLLELTRRMRQLAEEVFTTREIQLAFNAPDFAPEFKLDVNVRRDLYLIFKEAVNNAARHSGCTRAVIQMQMSGAQLHLTVSDNGRGFDPAQASDGNGLSSMHNRAKALGGELHIETGVGQGARVHLRAPLAQALTG
jgi:ligand-binding sensor domain-containing protein/signal transduction histidine kinase